MLHHDDARKPSLLIALALAAVPGVATATQTSGIVRAPEPPAVFTRLNTDGHAHGWVDRASVDPRGRPAGLLLRDGTWIEASPAQAARLAQIAPSGSEVRLDYGPAFTLRVSNARTGAAVDVGPLTPARGGGPNSSEGAWPPRADRAGLEALAVDGRVRAVFRSLSGKPAGVLLESGAQVHVPTSGAEVLRDVRAGEYVRVVGHGTRGAQGGVALWASRIERVAP